MKSRDMCLYSGKGDTIALCFSGAHVEFFESSGKFLTSHLARSFLDMIWNIIFKCFGYLRAIVSVKAALRNHKDTCLMSCPLNRRM